MARWRLWLECIGQAVLAQGLLTPTSLVSLGEAFWDISAAALELLRKVLPSETDRQAALQALLQAPAAEVPQEALAIARKEAAGQTSEVQEWLADFLIQVPVA